MAARGHPGGPSPAAGRARGGARRALPRRLRLRGDRGATLSGYGEAALERLADGPPLAGEEKLQIAAEIQAAPLPTASPREADAGLGKKLYVQYPASSPFALGCGGTEVTVENGKIASERAWSQEIAGTVYSTGGGLRDLFERPAWQDGIPLLEKENRRGVPDVAALADRESGVAFVASGTSVSGGGTSAVAPLWAALALRLGAALGCPLGHAPFCLYAAAGRDAGCFHDVTEGGNAAYRASSGWDAVTGLGSPDGERIVTALRGGAADQRSRQ